MMLPGGKECGHTWTDAENTDKHPRHRCVNPVGKNDTCKIHACGSCPPTQAAPPARDDVRDPKRIRRGKK